MGMYTEFIFGAMLKKDTPDEVIEILKSMSGLSEIYPEQLPDHALFKSDRWRALMTCCSAYFPVSSYAQMYKDEFFDCWVLSSRANLKDYGSEIKLFCDWIKPYIKDGSGYNDIYGISIYEEDSTPTIYSLD